MSIDANGDRHVAADTYAPRRSSRPSEPADLESSGTEIQLYESEDGSVTLDVRFDGDTVWATQAQMSELFGIHRDTVGDHIQAAIEDGELAREATAGDFPVVRQEGARRVRRILTHYNLDAILAVGYRARSPRASAFRRWATRILSQHVIDANARRLRELGAIAELLVTSHDDNLAGLGRILQRYAGDLDLLSDYDRGVLDVPSEAIATQRIDYQDVRRLIDELRARYPDDERLGIERDDAIHGVLGQIDQTFGGQDLYPTAQEKAANLLYMTVKDHPFSDGNKRTGAALFAYFLERNGALRDALGREVVPGNMLSALTLLVAASDPAKKDETVRLIRNLIAGGT